VVLPTPGSLSGSATVTNPPEVTVTNEITVRDADNAGRHAVTIASGASDRRL
jgi:hypothetical protein